MPQVSSLTRRAALMSAASLVFARAASAQTGVPADFPKRPMNLILPLAPGGPVDILGRLLAQEYQLRSGQQTSVENRTGGAGNIGIDAVRRAAPDGSVL